MRTLNVIIGFAILTILAACNKNEATVIDVDKHTDEMNYSVMIMKPDTSMKMLGDTMHMHVNFSEADGKTIHHVNVKIYQKDNPTNVIYNMPTDAHIHDMDGSYEHHDDLILSMANGVVGHKDYVMEAKIWGHDAGAYEQMMSREFHIHMMP